MCVTSPAKCNTSALFRRHSAEVCAEFTSRPVIRVKHIDKLHQVYIHLYSTHTHAFNGLLTGTTRMSRYQKGKTNVDFTEARHSEWQWHQLGRMQVCTSLHTDNYASTPPLFFCRPDAFPAAQPIVSKH